MIRAPLILPKPALNQAPAHCFSAKSNYAKCLSKGEQMRTEAIPKQQQGFAQVRHPLLMKYAQHDPIYRIKD